MTVFIDPGEPGSWEREVIVIESLIVVSAAVALGLPGLAATLHLGTLALASVFYRRPQQVVQGEQRFLVLIPAHNEELVIAKALAAIDGGARPRDTVLVVADRCTDATAEIASSLRRRRPRARLGRGARPAAARQAGLEHAERSIGTRY